MFKNYFKLALKVLGRRKFFTFISLFGISFTLMILMLVTAFLETELGSTAPMSKKDKMAFIDRVSMYKDNVDTVLVVDTSVIDNVVHYDTSYNYKEKGRNMWISPASIHFLEKYMKDIPFAREESFFSSNHSFDIYINSNKLTFGATYTDASFWRIHDFHFVEGGAYQQPQVDNQEAVAILSEKACREYFESPNNVVGKEIVLDTKHYKVIGVIKKANRSQFHLNSEVYLPYTHMNAKTLKSTSFMGPFRAIFLADSPANVEKIKSEIKKKAKLIPLPNPKEYNVLDLSPMNFAEYYSRSLIYHEDPAKSLKYLLGVFLFLITLFFLLPTLNLVNLNVSRILERSSEIGVRKAFGASSGNILVQFVFENIILTLIGGVIGFLLALLLINVINDSGYLPNIILSFNYKVFFYSLLICLFFGILSGIIPAYRMSRVPIINALKNNQL